MVPFPYRCEQEREPSMRVEIWSDVACPWCYVGKARFEKALAGFPQRERVEVVHRSFELDPGRARGDVEPVLTMLTRKYGMSEAQAQAGEDNLGAQAAAEGLAYRTRDRDNGGTFDMHRLLHLAKEHGRQSELLRILYRANFAEERSVFSEGDDRLVELAVEAGLDETVVRAVLADPDAYADAVRADEREAAELGANGVPFFVLDRKYGVSGAQPAEVFTRALTQAWEAHTPLRLLDGDGDGADACGPDGCAVPRN
ncbi:putative DsbA family dithiol-disulfide isomerase [Streptomyces sp. B3I7]|nr:putative DsbA family dithiol-disulfide isomerase [Streptomyces sp. B3I7]